MPSLSPRGTWQIFLPIAAAVLVLAWGIAADHVADVRQQTYLNAEHHVRTLAETHAQQTALTLTIAQEALIHLRATLQKEGFAQFEREAERLSGKGSGGPLNRVSLVAADGRMLANHLDGRRGSLANISDRAYFQEIRQWDEDRVHVTEPFRGRFTGEWIVLFSQAVRQNGRFDGLVQVGLPAERLGLMFHTVGGAGEVVSLLSPGGRIIARSNGTEHIGRTADLPTGTDGTTLSHTSPVDGVRRLVSVSTIPGFDLRVVAGTDLQVLDAEIGEHTRVAYLPALLLTVLLVPAALLILYAGRSQQVTHLALQAETRRSRTVFETMGEGILLLDADATVSFANTRAGIWLPQAAGRRLTEALQDADFTLVSESGQAVAGGNPVIERCLAAGEDIDGIWLKRGSGSNEIWLALRARAFGDTDGAVLGATITLADRSEEHERLMESALSSGIIEGMQDAVMITDARGRILRVNPAFCELSGYTAAEVLGRTPAILRSGRHDAAFFTGMWKALTETGQWSGRVWNQRKSGEEYCVWHSITSVRDVHGRIARYITVSRDITEQESRESELWQRANFDPLTGLANRARFADRLAQAIANAQRNDHGFAVCYLDLDRFKPVNDTLGHAAGDALLRQVAQRMRSLLREEDTLARIGGDEFALLLPRIRSSGDVARVAAKIIDLVHAPFDLAEGTASIGISIGIALFPEDGEDGNALGDAADRALYAAKASGRNCWRFADDAGQPPRDGERA